MSELTDRIPALEKDIVVSVQVIQGLQADKKAMASSFNENIKDERTRRDALIQELEGVKEKIKQEGLVADADEILELDASPESKDLKLIA